MDIEIEFEALAIDDRGDCVRVAGVQRGTPREVTARRGVLAAGCFGNTRLLKQSHRIARRLPALGKAFCCHPQFMTFGVYDEPVDAHRGPLQAVQAHDPSLRRDGVKLENVFAGPIAHRHAAAGNRSGTRAADAAIPLPVVDRVCHDGRPTGDH